MFVLFFLKQKTAYEMRISDWSSDVCSSDLHVDQRRGKRRDHHEDDRDDEYRQDDVVAAGDEGDGAAEGLLHGGRWGLDGLIEGRTAPASRLRAMLGRASSGKRV